MRLWRRSLWFMHIGQSFPQARCRYECLLSRTTRLRKLWEPSFTRPNGHWVPLCRSFLYSQRRLGLNLTFLTWRMRRTRMQISLADGTRRTLYRTDGGTIAEWIALCNSFGSFARMFGSGHNISLCHPNTMSVRFALRIFSEPAGSLPGA